MSRPLSLGASPTAHAILTLACEQASAIDQIFRHSLVNVGRLFTTVARKFTQTGQLIQPKSADSVYKATEAHQKRATTFPSPPRQPPASHCRLLFCSPASSMARS